MDTTAGIGRQGSRCTRYGSESVGRAKVLVDIVSLQVEDDCAEGGLQGDNRVMVRWSVICAAGEGRGRWKRRPERV